MNAKPSIAVLALLGVPIMLVSAPAQQSYDRDSGIGVLGRIMSDSNQPSGQPGGSQTQRKPFFYQPDGGQMFSVARAVTQDPEKLLARRTEELARKLGEAKSESDKSEIKTELAAGLEKQFDLRQKRHHDEIAELEAKVKQLKDLVEKRQENRREIVAKRLDQILRDAEGLGW